MRPSMGIGRKGVSLPRPTLDGNVATGRLAAVALRLASLVVALLLTAACGMPPLPFLTPRITTEPPGIEARLDLVFSGEFAGTFTDPVFTGYQQKCGPGGPFSLPPSYGINGILGKVGTEKVLIGLYVTPYTGPGSYEVASARHFRGPTAAPATRAPTATPFRDMTFSVVRITGSALDGGQEDWVTASGSFTISADELSGALDIELQPRDVDGRTLRVVGSWKCSQAEFVVKP